MESSSMARGPPERSCTIPGETVSGSFGVPNFHYNALSYGIKENLGKAGKGILHLHKNRGKHIGQRALFNP